jgi:hypothetical protein
MFVTEMKQGDMNGFGYPTRSSYTGYLCKKLLHYRSGSTNNNYSNYNYAFPIIRLADLYLLYAEALNEIGGETPDDDVYEYVNMVRRRSGLVKCVKDAWNDHAIVGRKSLPLTRSGMREIIRRERLNELAFEGARFWDLRRWKLAEDYLNRPIRGLDVQGETAAAFYLEQKLFDLKFDKKDYFTPIRTEVLVSNTNLLQSPYW